MKCKYFLLLLFLSFGQYTIAQVDSAANLFISGQPLYLFNRGIRIDVDSRIKQSNHWMQTGIEVYLDHFRDTSLTSTAPYMYADGFGINLNHKVFKDIQTKSTRTYLAYGLSFQYTAVEYRAETWKTYIQDGLTFMSPGKTRATQHINKYGANIMIGIQTFLIKNLYFDIYTGLGVRYSYSRSSALQKLGLDEYWWSYGYTGTLMLGGVKFGILF